MAFASTCHHSTTVSSESPNVRCNRPRLGAASDNVTGPIAPGQSRTYRFKCTQFGTTWYHSHFSAQYGDGLVGAMIINGPASANYDIDLGALPITDWFYRPAFELNLVALRSNRGPPRANNILVNGTMVNANGGGSYNKITVTKGKKYRLRLINTSVDTHIHVSLASTLPDVSVATRFLIGVTGRPSFHCHDVRFCADQTFHCQLCLYGHWYVKLTSVVVK